MRARRWQSAFELPLDGLRRVSLMRRANHGTAWRGRLIAYSYHVDGAGLPRGSHQG